MILGLTNWRLSCQKSFYNYLNAPIHIYQQKSYKFMVKKKSYSIGKGVSTLEFYVKK